MSYPLGPNRVPSNAEDRLLERLKSLEIRLQGVERRGVGSIRGKAFAKTITGDGSETDFTIIHNLKTRDCIVQIRADFSPWERVAPADYDVEFTTINTIEVKWAAAPGNDDDYRILIVAL